MQAVHKTLLEVNEEFLVSEAPTTPLLHALLRKGVLTDLDLQQLSSLEPQGSRALKRFVLHVLPLRGPLAYPAFLEALQEAQAQHLVDLLLEGEAVLNAAVKPIDLQLEPTGPPSQTPSPDPNEYARKLSANRELIEQAVQPRDVAPSLQRAGVISPLEDALLEKVKGQHALTWSVLWGVLLQRGLRAYSVFMGALLQHGYPALFHTIEETKVNGADAMMTALNRNMAANDVTNPDSAHNPHNTQQQPPYRTSSHTVQTSSQLFTDRTPTRPEMRNVSQPHTEPLSARYSLGDMEFILYTPRTWRQQGLGGAPSGTSLSNSVDMLYDPSWADPYNHLRSSDLVTPRSLLDTTPQPQISTLLLNRGNESADPDQAQSNGHIKTPSAVANQTGLDDDHERASPTQVADSQKDAEPVPNPPEEAVSEQAAGTDDQRGPVSEESTEKPSSAKAPDDTQVSAKPLDDPELRKTPTLSEEPKAHESTDDSKSNPPDDQNLKET